MKEILIKNAYINSFGIDDEVLSDIALINTKSLIDDKIQRYVYIDDGRLKGELIYYRYYGEKKTSSNILNILLPLILANTNINKSEEEVIDLIHKYVNYFKLGYLLFEYTMAAVMYNTMIHLLLDDKDIQYQDLLQKMKESIIGLNIELDKGDIVKFQMSRIQAIQVIDEYIDIKCYDYGESVLKDFLNVVYDVYQEDRVVSDKGILSIKKSILSILGNEVAHDSIDNLSFIKSMSDYLLKLRSYKISKKMFNQKVDPRYLINLKLDETVQDPILNQTKIISKNDSNESLNIEIVCKSGRYTFNFIKQK